MNAKMIVALVLAVALVPLAPSGIASHTGMYSRTPVEHDDQGRSVEPDFASTSIFGPTVQNAVIDTDMNGIAVPDSALGNLGGKVLAPGCTDDSGRRPSGLCGLYTVGAGTPAGATVTVVPPFTAGVTGMSGQNAPGAFTPSKGTPVRFLDVIHHSQQNSAGSTYIEWNRKLDDSGLRPVLASVDPNLGNNVVFGGTAIWAWYGKWTDKNGNGVIDGLYDAGTTEPYPLVPGFDEFVWYGNCRKFPSAPSPSSITAGFCALDTEAASAGTTRMLGFIYPGNHHSFCGGTVDPLFVSCGNVPADIPARQVIHFTGAVGLPKPCADGVTNLGIFCDGNIRTFDQTDDDFFADPLLGPQGSVAWDQSFDDRTGDPRRDVRQWAYGLGWTTYFYDQSIANSLVQVSTVGCKDNAASPNQVDLNTCRFSDVDKFNALSPAAEGLLRGTVKPAARDNWVFVRDAYIPFQTTVDGATNNAAADTSATTGPLDDQTQNPGYGREPNDALDSFPGATRGSCGDSKAQHYGWCNSYAAGAKAYGDIVPVRSIIINRPVGVGGGCVLCVAGTFLTTGYQGEAPSGSPAPVLRASGDYRNTLGPGQYQFGSAFGTWTDKAQTWEESFFDVLTQSTVTNVYSAPADGWVGNVVNATGTWYYRGYSNEVCTTELGAAVRTYGACNPYLDGAISNPQQYGGGNPAHGEWVPACNGVANGGIVVTPADGVWNVPVFVYRSHQLGINLANPQETTARIEDKTGFTGPIVLSSGCSSFLGALAIADLLILPAGNAGETLRTSVTVTVGTSTVTDVDTYHG